MTFFLAEIRQVTAEREKKRLLNYRDDDHSVHK